MTVDETMKSQLPSVSSEIFTVQVRLIPRLRPTNGATTYE